LARLAAALLIALVLLPFSAPFPTYDLRPVAASGNANRFAPSRLSPSSFVNLATSHVLIGCRLDGRGTALSAAQQRVDTFGQPDCGEVRGATRAFPRTLAAALPPVPRL
jgi:hypothetical protein